MPNVDSTDFVNALELRGQRFSNVSLDALLGSVFDFSNVIWGRPRLHTFVDHGIDHSYRVLTLALSFLKILNRPEMALSPVERLVLGIACLIHDIGMQYQAYPVKEVDLDPFQIRKQHTALGFEMIAAVREGTFTSQRAGPPLNIHPQHLLFLHYGAMVGYSHSGRTYWDQITTSATYEMKREGGEQLIRPRLLAALVRLADELHCEYTRIQDLTWLDTALLTSEEKAHWAACYFTQEVRITSPGPAGLRMNMTWRVPDDATEKDIEIVRALLQELREHKMLAETQLVRGQLKEDDRAEPCFLEFNLAETPQKFPMPPIPDAVCEYVTTKLRPGQFGKKIQHLSGRARELTGSATLDALKHQARQFLLTKGLVAGHFRLRTGWHTNKYVRCRELCADARFISGLCMELKAFYSASEFTDVLAIGTSAIGIATLLSQMMGLKFSYTFQKQSGTKTDATGRYTEFEIRLDTYKQARVLIIDDIIGVGSVLHEIIPALGKESEAPELVRAFSIFSLGNVKTYLEGDLSLIDVDYLVEFPDVEYSQENPVSGRCDKCPADRSVMVIEE